jgi:hypothetical protein
MIGSAQEHAALADTAIATPAVVEHVHAGPLQGVNDALIGRDRDDLTGRMELHFEGAIGSCSCSRLRLEEFVMDAIRRKPLVGRALFYGLNHPCRSADIDVGLAGGAVERGRDIQPRLIAVIVDREGIRANRAELQQKRETLRRAPCIVQPIRRSPRLQLGRHRQDRRNPDATGKKDGRCVSGMQAKIVDRRRCPHDVANLQCVHEAGAPRARLLPQDPEGPATLWQVRQRH